MKFFEMFSPKPKTPSDIKLEKIINMLFPPLELREDKEGRKYHVDYSVDANLEAALNDLEEGYNDDASRKTIKGVSDRLFEVRQYLEVMNELDRKAQYLIVDEPKEFDPESIKPSDRG